jgi:hypothetical protein
MTDPDNRNIKDERYHRDAVLRYVESTELRCIHAGWLAHFKECRFRRLRGLLPVPSVSVRA